MGLGGKRGLPQPFPALAELVMPTHRRSSILARMWERDLPKYTKCSIWDKKTSDFTVAPTRLSRAQDVGAQGRAA